MALLFAGNRVGDFAAALGWYERLLGGEPAFFPHEKEAVWELDESRYLYIVEDAAPGGGLATVIVDDLDGRVAEISERGIEPAEREQYSSGARKAIYRDQDGNEVGFGGVPSNRSAA